MNDNAIMAMIEEDEGRIDHIYLDSEKNPTCGVGHLLAVGSKVPPAAVQAFLKQDFQIALADYLSLVRLYNFSLDPIRRAVLINMLFNMGLTRVRKFVLMIKALQAEDWAWAAEEMVDSRWYRQTKNRAKRLVKMMREGEV